jgi:hypothetical protein
LWKEMHQSHLMLKGKQNLKLPYLDNRFQLLASWQNIIGFLKNSSFLFDL